MKTASNNKIDAYDRCVPELFHQASSDAFNSALEAGIAVTIIEDGIVCRVQTINGKIVRTKLKKARTQNPAIES